MLMDAQRQATGHFSVAVGTRYEAALLATFGPELPYKRIELPSVQLFFHWVTFTLDMLVIAQPNSGQQKASINCRE